MKKKQVLEIIERGWSIFEFSYNEKDCSIDPYFDKKLNRQVYHLYCDGQELIVFSVDEAMNTPFFDGKPLNEIAELITDIYY